MSVLFRWPCSILSICLPGLSLLVSALFRRQCSFSVGHAAFLFISLPGLSLCNISIHVFSRSVTAGVRPFPLAMQHFYSFPKQFTVRGSQCFKEWSPWWCWMVWLGSRPACLPLPFICLPILFICFPPNWVLVVGFPAGLSPTPFHLSPTSFHLSPSSLTCLSGWVLVCLPLLFICLSGWVLVVGFPAGLSPTSFHLSLCLWSACGRVPGWLVSHFLSFSVLVLGFQAGLSPTSLNVSPTSFHLSPGLFPTSLHVSPISFYLSPASFVSHVCHC